MAARNMDPWQAQKYLLDHRSHVHSTLPDREVVKQFWEELQQSHDSKLSAELEETGDRDNLAE